MLLGAIFNFTASDFFAQKTAAVSSGCGQIKQIAIESSAWSGVKTIRQRMTIRATKSGYAANGHNVESKIVCQLLSAISSPPKALGLEALGVSSDQLRQSRVGEGDFLEAIDQYYRHSVILDVDAEFMLEIVQLDGTKVKVRSSNSQAYMVPWKVDIGASGFETFNVKLSEAIAKLLPDGFLNRSRIGGTPHGRDLINEILNPK